MKKYDYYSAVYDDVYEYINDTYDAEELADCMLNMERFKDKLYDDLFLDDSVTGNGSGSYTFSTAEAEENLCGNMNLYYEAMREFYHDSISTHDDFDAEYADVTIRCYLLYKVIEDVLSDIASGSENE